MDELERANASFRAIVEHLRERQFGKVIARHCRLTKNRGKS